MENSLGAYESGQCPYQVEAKRVPEITTTLAISPNAMDIMRRRTETLPERSLDLAITFFVAPGSIIALSWQSSQGSMDLVFLFLHLVVVRRRHRRV